MFVKGISSITTVTLDIHTKGYGYLW